MRRVFIISKYLNGNRYYFPDSYDKWDQIELPVDPPEVSEYLEAMNEPTPAYRVAANWLLDLDQYNEWMNEEDYEVDISGTTYPLLSKWFFDFISCIDF